MVFDNTKTFVSMLDFSTSRSKLNKKLNLISDLNFNLSIFPMNELSQFFTLGIKLARFWSSARKKTLDLKGWVWKVMKTWISRELKTLRLWRRLMD